MGKKDDYKKGMADAMGGFTSFGEKQEAATEHLAEEVGKAADKVNQIGDKIGEVVDYISDQEKAELYKLNSPIDIADLESTDQNLLLAILYQLSTQESPTEEQQNYIRSVQQYLKIPNPQSEADLTAVERVEDISAQKALLQASLEFFQLGSHPETFTTEQEDFLSYFQLNLRTRSEISRHIDAIINAVGPKGLAEKYGFVPQPIEYDETTIADEPDETERMIRKMHITSGLLQSQLQGISAFVADIQHSKVSDYVILLDDELDTAMMANSNNLSAELLSAYQSGNLIAGYDTPEADGLDSIYFSYTTIFVKNSGNMESISYNNIVRLEITQTYLTLYGKEKSITIFLSDDISLHILKNIRKVLIEVCADMPTFLMPDDEWTIERIIHSNIQSICCSSSAHCYASTDFYGNEKKLLNALDSYALRVEKDDVIAFIDTSLLSNGKAGLLFSKTGVAFDYAFTKVFLRYDEIDHLELKKKDLIFYGSFGNLKDSYINPSIPSIYFDLAALKACLDEICLYA